MDTETKPLTSTGQGQIKSSDWSLRGALIFVCIVAAVFIGLFGWQTSRVNQTSSDSSGSVVVDCSSSCPCEPDCSTCPSDCSTCPPDCSTCPPDCSSCAAYTNPSQYCLDQGLGYDGSAWCETNMPAYTDPNGYCDSSDSELNCANAASKCPDIVLVSASACSDAGYYSCEAALVDCSSCASTNCDPTVVCASGYIPDDQCTPAVVCASGSGYIPDDQCDTCCSPTVVCASGSGYIPDNQCNTCCASGSTVSSCTDISGCIDASDCNTCCPSCPSCESWNEDTIVVGGDGTSVTTNVCSQDGCNINGKYEMSCDTVANWDGQGWNATDQCSNYCSDCCTWVQGGAPSPTGTGGTGCFPKHGWTINGTGKLSGESLTTNSLDNVHSLGNMNSTQVQNKIGYCKGDGVCANNDYDTCLNNDGCQWDSGTLENGGWSNSPGTSVSGSTVGGNYWDTTLGSTQYLTSTQLGDTACEATTPSECVNVGVNWDGTQWNSTDKCFSYCANTCDWNGAPPDEGGGCFPKYDMMGYKLLYS